MASAPTTPRLILLATAATGLLSLVFALAASAHAAMADELFVAAFDLVAALGAAFALLVGLGRFRDGPAIALFCTGLTLCAAAAATFVVGRGSGYRLPGLGLRSGAALVGLLGFAHFGLAGLILISRNPRRSVPLLIKGILLGIPVVAAAVAGFALPVQSILGSMHFLVATAIVVVGFFVLVAFISASAHCLIRAFEIGVQTAEATADGRQVPPGAPSRPPPTAGVSEPPGPPPAASPAASGGGRA